MEKIRVGEAYISDKESPCNMDSSPNMALVLIKGILGNAGQRLRLEVQSRMHLTALGLYEPSYLPMVGTGNETWLARLHQNCWESCFTADVRAIPGL